MTSTRDDKTPPNHDRSNRHDCHQCNAENNLEDESLDVLVMSIDECEWVDDAVLTITSAFGLCHTRDYADRQIEYEHALQKCQRGREMANESNMDVGSARHNRTGRSLISTVSSSDDENCPEQLLRINSMTDDVFLDNAGMEVQLHTLYYGARTRFPSAWVLRATATYLPRFVVSESTSCI
jgi:hypothetical protein